MKNHIVDITIGAEDLTLIHTQIDALQAKVDQYGITLDATQRKSYSRLGQRNETFSRSVLDLAAQRPDIVPAWASLTSINRDIVAREQVMPMLLQVKAIAAKLEDTCTALGIDIYEGARGIYKSAKAGGEVTGVSEVLKEIGKRFKRPRSKKDDTNGGTSGTESTPVA